MNVTGSLLKRNILIFVRDRSAVFFSVLTMLIVLGLMVLFLGDMNSRDIVEALNRAGGDRDAVRDRENADYLIQMWTLAGILTTNAITVTMTVMGNLIRDRARNRLASFFVTPVSRLQIALGYILSAWIIGSVMCLLTLAVAEGYMVMEEQELLAASAWLKLAGMIALNTFVYAAIAYLIALFVSSESAWSGLLTVIGTLVGFVGAIYLPMAALPEKVAAVLKYLPVLHGAAMMRGVCTQKAAEITFAGLPSEAVETFNEKMGVSIVMGENVVSFGAQMGYLLILAAVVIVLAAVVSRKKERTM